MNSLIIGTRGSALALAQTRWVASALRKAHPGLNIEERVIRTTGDAAADAPLASLGSVGLFTSELERALLDGDVDIAVHSMKDLPTESPAELAVVAVPQREDPRDALVLPEGQNVDPQELRELPLPPGAVVATCSLRRRAQLAAGRPDLSFAEIRGNVDTRLRKLDSGQFSACVLASAGLIRLGLADRAALPLAPALCTPAPGQGALAVQARADRPELAQLVSVIHHADTWAASTAERAVLRLLGGGCQVPMGAFARVDGGRLAMIVRLADPFGQQVIRVDAEGDPRDPEAVARVAAAALRQQGADRFLEAHTG